MREENAAVRDHDLICSETVVPKTSQERPSVAPRQCVVGERPEITEDEEKKILRVFSLRTMICSQLQSEENCAGEDHY